MTLFLDRVDSVPNITKDYDTQFLQWLWTLVDVLNEDLTDIQSAILSTNIISGLTQDAEVNSLYIPTNVALTTFTLPVTAVVGGRVTIAGQGAGGWKLIAAPLQTIKVADVGGTTIAGGSIASSSRYDSIEIVCVVANTTWITLSTQTTGFVIV